MKKTVKLLMMLLIPLYIHTEPTFIPKQWGSLLSSFFPAKKKTEEKTQIGFLSITGHISSAGKIAKDLYAIKKNPDVKALFLHIDSEGGSLTSAEIIASALKEFKQLKPVVVFIENTCCSSAYLIASAATTIIAAGQMATIGSIGVVHEFEIDKNKKEIVMTGGNFKRPTINENYDINNEYTQYIKELVDEDYEIFCTQIAQNRNLPVESVQKQEARVFNSKKAFELGLIDAIESLSETIATTAELIKRNGGEVRGSLVLVDEEGNEVLSL